MKGVHESIFISSLRAFLVALFGVLGAIIAVVVVTLIFIGIASALDEETFSSTVKILPDAHSNREKLSMSTPVLLQITIDGTIGSGKITGEKIQEILLDSREDGFKNDRIKGILLVINSPGGGVNDSDIIYRHLKEYKKLYNVPIYAYVDGLCASGGYYVACAADEIFASEVSLIGSIGVLAWPPFMNLYDALEKIGVSSLTLSAGKGKDEMNPFRPWKPDEQKHYQSLIDYYYNNFVAIVSEDRSLDKEEIVSNFGAEVYPSPKAKALGLVDHADASRSQAITALAKAAGVEEKYQVVGLETKSWWKKLLKEEPSSPLITGKIKHELAFPGHDGNPFSYIFKP